MCFGHPGHSPTPLVPPRPAGSGEPPRQESCWLLPVEEKKKLWGRQRVAVGGKSGVGSDAEDDDALGAPQKRERLMDGPPGFPAVLPRDQDLPKRDARPARSDLQNRRAGVGGKRRRVDPRELSARRGAEDRQVRCEQMLAQDEIRIRDARAPVGDDLAAGEDLAMDRLCALERLAKGQGFKRWAAGAAKERFVQ